MKADELPLHEAALLLALRDQEGTIVAGTSYHYCKKGILRADEDRVLGIFNRKVYPEADPRPERRLIEQIRAAVLSDSNSLDPRTVVLISLARHSGLLRSALTRQEIKASKARLAQIEDGDAVGKAVKGAIEAMNAALMTAAIIPAICASSS